MVDGTNGSEPKRKTGAGSRGRPLTMVHEVGEIDGRSAAVVRYRRLVQQIAEDLGGVGELSAAQLELVRRAGGLGLLTAKIEAELLADRAANVERYVQAVHAQARVLATLGLGRRPKDVTPRLADILREDEAA